MNQIDKIRSYQEASYTCLYVLTHEENRFLLELETIREKSPNITIIKWDCQNGLRHVCGPQEPVKFPADSRTSITALECIQSYSSAANKEEEEVNANTLFVLQDFHLHFDKPSVIRTLRNSWNILKNKGNMIVFTGHKFSLPGELHKEVQVVDYDLPREEAINERLDYVLSSVNTALKANKKREVTIESSIRESIVEAAKGMTHNEIENAFAMAWTTVKKFDSSFADVVFQEKIAQLKKNGLLTYMEPNISFENVGGLQGLKNWLTARKKAYSKEARTYNLPLPKGMLLASVPGTGKSLICKAIAKEFDCPLFALDLGSIFDSLVGNSEKNMREMIKTVESIGKCVLLVDEIEKSLSNSAVSGAGDSGVSSRIFGTFLTWLNDRKNPAFIVATTNDHTKLPAALIRKGRFDQLFWLDLPSADERKEIFDVVIKKYNRDPKDFSVKQFAKQTEDFTGAEIEEVFKDAMYKAFDAGEEVSDSDVFKVVEEFIPFAVSHEMDLDIMRQQAQGKLVMISSAGEPVSDVVKNTRKLSISIE